MINLENLKRKSVTPSSFKKTCPSMGEVIKIYFAPFKKEGPNYE